MHRTRPDGMEVNVQSTTKTIRRLHSLTATAIAKGGDDRARIEGAVCKILLDCFDETYDAIGRDPVLLTQFDKLDINYGYED